VYYTWDVLVGILENRALGRTWLERAAIFSAFNIALMVMFSIGWWRNRWVRARMGLKSFDEAFSKVALMMGVANACIVGLPFLVDARMASVAFALVMLPVVIASNYGYTRVLREFASGQKNLCRC